MKHSLHSSKRKAKRSQNGSKKISKSSSEKVQKLKRHDSPFSSSNEEDSISKSRGGNDGKGKKRGRYKEMRSRRDKKKRKKSRLENESSGDDTPRVKEPKRLKKDKSSDSRKRLSGKKRRRRDHSVSSTSRSRSGSISERSNDSEEEFERKYKKVESKKSKRREKKSDRRKVSRRRLKSCFPCLDNDSGEASSPKRLKSMIVVANEREVIEEQKSMMDERPEDEIICKFNDDNSSKGIDSIDCATLRKEIPNLHEVSSEKWLDEPNKKLASINVETLKGLGSKRQVVEGSERISPQSAVNSPLIGNTSEVCETTSSMCVDLEASLRQKALENLLKRQGKLSTNNPSDKKGGNDIEKTKPSIVNAQQVDQRILHDEGNIKFTKNLGKSVNDERIPQDDGNLKSFQKLGKVGNDVRKGLDDEHLPQDNGNIKSLQKVGTVIDDENMPRYNKNIKSEQMVGKGVDNVRNTTQLSYHNLNVNVENAHLANKSKVSSNFVNKRPNVSLSMSRNEFLRGKNTWKRHSTPQNDCQVNQLSLRETIVKDATQQFTLQEDTRRPQEISKETTKDSSSRQFDSKISVDEVEVGGGSDPSPFGGKSTNDKTSENDKEKQFQEKTMSVMRGDEMVQVSYKVYIPNKTPALARRKLKR